MKERPNQKKASYQDRTRSVEERVSDLMARMTLDEKLAQLSGIWVFELLENSAFSEEKAQPLIGGGIGQISRLAGATRLGPEASAELANCIQTFLVENTRLGIPAIIHEECCSGYMARGATCFPQIIGLASTWEPGLVREMTSVIRTQMRSVGARQGLCPVLDVTRDPRWGRVEETFGEDPHLVSRMGVSYVKGLQGNDLKQGIIATGKHFVAYGLSEGGMNCAPVHLAQRELFETFLKPFVAVIKEAKLASIMNAYHEIDGVPCGSSKELLTEILRDLLGFDGIVVSDYFAVKQLFDFHHVAKDESEAAKTALEAGIDMELPSTDCYGRPLRAAVQKGTVDESLVDRSVRRVLRMKFLVGLFEDPYVDTGKVPAVFDLSEQRALACKIARKSIVLLKNEDDLLPLSKNLPSIAVLGPSADSARNMFGDYSYPAHSELMMGENPDLYISIPTVLEGIRRVVSPETVLRYAAGCEVSDMSKRGFQEAIEAAEKSEVAVLVLGGKSGLTQDCTCGEFRDRADIGVPGVQEELIQAVYETGTPVVLVLINGRPFSIPWIVEHVPAIVEAWLPGEAGGAAVAEVLFGDYNPGGRLPITFPRSVGQIPVYYNRKPSGGRSQWYGDYVSMSAQPLFSFGHGLSYTRFEYENLSIEPRKVGVTGDVEISIHIKNVGERRGDEVVQLYIHDVLATVTRPVMELKGFKRLTLNPGEKRTVTFTLSIAQCGFYDRNMEFVVEPGRVDVMVGSSSGDMRLSQSFEIVGEVTTRL
jgi:beta-glucosidase